MRFNGRGARRQQRRQQRVVLSPPASTGIHPPLHPLPDSQCRLLLRAIVLPAERFSMDMGRGASSGGSSGGSSRGTSGGTSGSSWALQTKVKMSIVAHLPCLSPPNPRTCVASHVSLASCSKLSPLLPSVKLKRPPSPKVARKGGSIVGATMEGRAAEKGKGRGGKDKATALSAAVSPTTEEGAEWLCWPFPSLALPKGWAWPLKWPLPALALQTLFSLLHSHPSSPRCPLTSSACVLAGGGEGWGSTPTLPHDAPPLWPCRCLSVGMGAGQLCQSLPQGRVSGWAWPLKATGHREKTVAEKLSSRPAAAVVAAEAAAAAAAAAAAVGG
ncbi:unnamed protein product [Closterium sp. NIES-65]|nr:unnamed protein product [Closterium sp. NIES-65]